MVRRKIVVLMGTMAMSSLLCAQSDTITIKRHSRGGKNSPGELALLYGDLDGHAVVLQCMLSHSDCKELEPGEYNIERLLEGEGSYKNCPNVDLYREGANSFSDEPLGEYCLREHK